MFRDMRRSKQQVSLEECKRILNEEKRCVLALIGDNGYPYAIPMNFYYDGSENRLYFHCARMGHKIDAIRQCDKVCVTVWNKGFKKENDWAWNVTSVVIFGRAELIGDKSVTAEKVRRLAERHYPTSEAIDKEMDKALNAVQLIAVSVEHITGKLVNES